VGVILEGIEMHYRELERIFKATPRKHYTNNCQILLVHKCNGMKVYEKKLEGPDLPQNDYTLT
jgi:hypothetical protein